MSPVTDNNLKVGIVGLGTIGSTLAQHLHDGIDGLSLSSVAVGDPNKNYPILKTLKVIPKIVNLEEISGISDVVVECAPSAIFDKIAVPAIHAGLIFIPASVGALLDRPYLIDKARSSGARIMVPTGALLGLDAVRAASEGNVHSVQMITRKPPAGLKGAPYLEGKNINLDRLTEPLRLYSGSAREAVRGFPANVNVAAALSLAGIGPDKTDMEIWADPDVTRNTHDIIVVSDSARLTMRIENIPSKQNKRTGRITALSILATLRGLTATLKIGT